MGSATQIAQRASAPTYAQLGRRCLACAAVVLAALILARSLAIESFHIPTGSMAPALRGQHRNCACPRCGHEVAVGRHAEERDGTDASRLYRKAFCQNCGFQPLPVTSATETTGDEVLVNKAAFLVRSPSRWEIVVFRLLGSFYIKRILGLPGEAIAIHDGDLYVNGRLCRKEFSQARRMGLLIFEQTRNPKAGHWKDRWEHDSPLGVDSASSLDGRTSAAALTYRNYSPDSRKCEPIGDEYEYNVGFHPGRERVHDFLIDTQLEVTGAGTVALRLCDGHDWVEVVLGVGKDQPAAAFTWPIGGPDQRRRLAESQHSAALRSGSRHRVELAFVDRRLTLALADQVLLQADLPEAKVRGGVERPFQVQAEGVQATLHRFKLYRDVHYGQQGVNATAGKSVHLGVDQFFLCGDNSPHSEDSRHWQDGGAVPRSALVGPLLAMPGGGPARTSP